MVASQNNTEADFIIAMGDLLKDGYWQNDNYAPGQEQALYDDAVDRMDNMSKPVVTYRLSFSSLLGTLGYTESQLRLNALARVYDPDLDVNDTMYVDKITRYLDDSAKDTVEVTTQSVTLSNVSLSSILSRMTQLSDLIKQKNSIYERAGAISPTGKIRTDLLEGQINILTTQLSSAMSNWYTDQNGNLVFESATGQSAMMLTGDGFMIASGRTDSGAWNWRIFGTGEGFTADAIVTGYLSAERIEANSITANKLASDVGSSLDLSSNKSITLTVRDIVDDVISSALTLDVSQNMPAVQIFDPNPGGGYAPDWSVTP